jgi:hypothetical protein
MPGMYLSQTGKPLEKKKKKKTEHFAQICRTSKLSGFFYIFFLLFMEIVILSTLDIDVITQSSTQHRYKVQS